MDQRFVFGQLFVTDLGNGTANRVKSIIYLKGSFWVMGEIGSCLVIVTIS